MKQARLYLLLAPDDFFMGDDFLLTGDEGDGAMFIVVEVFSLLLFILWVSIFKSVGLLFIVYITL